MAIAYADHAGLADQAQNMGGLTQTIYIAPVRDFATIEAVAAAPATEAAAVEITGTHVFSTGKKFMKVYCTLDKGEVSFEPQGERDGRSFKQLAKIFHPGAGVDEAGFAALSANDKFIVIVKMPDGKMIQIGSADFYAEIIGKFGSGTNSGGLRGYEFEISSMAPVNYIYSGTIALTPAV